MTVQIRETQKSDIAAIQDFTISAFEPIFDSFKMIMGPKLFSTLYPDWRQIQRDLVTSLYENDTSIPLTALLDETPAGYLTYRLDHESLEAEIEFLVVHPGYQQQGIGSQLNDVAVAAIREAGMKLVYVSTGGDEAHAPARRAYERMGYIPVPAVNYFQVLG